MIKFNEITWYSRLAAILFFLAVFPILCFYIGTKYQEVREQSDVQHDQSSMSLRQHPENCPNGTLVKTLNGMQCDVSESEAASSWKTYKDERFEFSYSAEYGTSTYQVFGSSNELNFGNNRLTVAERLNYNNLTGSKYTLSEFVKGAVSTSTGEAVATSSIMVDGIQGLKVFTCKNYTRYDSCVTDVYFMTRNKSSFIIVSSNVSPKEEVEFERTINSFKIK